MSLLNIFLGEMLGTAVLILLGNGVVANVVFKKTQGSGSGLIVITFGWALAVFTGVMVANVWGTGGHLNPAVTIGQMVGGKISAAQGFVYFSSEALGAVIGQIAVTTMYFKHIKEEGAPAVLSMHSTGPTHEKGYFANFVSEYLGTMVLVVTAFFAIQGNWFGGAPVAIALVVLGIGVSLGGTTGYAINPFRDLVPRILHTIMYKGLGKKLNLNLSEGTSSNWKYAYNPVVAPLSAGVTFGAFLWL